MQHTFSVLAEDRPGVLARLAGLVSRRGYNVSSLSVGQTERPGFSRFTLVVGAEETAEGQIVRQLEKLVETVDVRHLESGGMVERQLLLVKVRAPLELRATVLQTAGIFRCRVVDMGRDAVVFELTGDRRKGRVFLEAMRPFGVLEAATSGAVALERVGFGEEAEGEAFVGATAMTA